MWFSLFLFLIGVGFMTGEADTVYGDDLISAPIHIWPPTGKKIKCPIIRDAWISSLAKEKLGNNGGSRRLKGNDEICGVEPSYIVNI